MRLVDIYGDQGKSGRSIKGRPELQRLIRDCEAGKIKLILTKSISRFARNMMECVATIRHLSALGVTIRFEKEDFETNSVGGELMLSILATVAQEESLSIGKNLQWSRQEHIERGEPWEAARYGYISVGENHRWQIIPKEAEIVRVAFYMAGLCYKIPDIITELNSMEAARGSSRIWNYGTLRELLTSLVYVGDYLSNKNCKAVDRDGNVKYVKNKGQVDQVLIEGHHAPIVCREIFDIVQILVAKKLLSAKKKRFLEDEVLIMGEARKLTVANMNEAKLIEAAPELPKVATSKKAAVSEKASKSSNKKRNESQSKSLDNPLSVIATAAAAATATTVTTVTTATTATVPIKAVSAPITAPVVDMDSFMDTVPIRLATNGIPDIIKRILDDALISPILTGESGAGITGITGTENN